MRRLLRPSLLSLLTATAACAGNTSSNGAAAPDTTGAATTGTTAGTLRIENRTNRDMDIFVRGQSRAPVRVGFVPGGETATFKMSPAMLSAASSFRLEARPISGGGSATLSEPFPVRRGEETFWSIPP